MGRFRAVEMALSSAERLSVDSQDALKAELARRGAALQHFADTHLRKFSTAERERCAPCGPAFVFLSSDP